MAMKRPGYNDPDYALGEAPLAPSVPEPQSSRKSSTPAPAAPAAPNAFTYKPPALGGYDEYMAQQQTAFNPVAIGGGGGYMHDSYETPYTLYSQFDPGATHKTYMDTLYSELGVSPELGNIFDEIYGYRGAKEDLAKSIGYTGRTGVNAYTPDGGNNEGGSPLPDPLGGMGISPEYAQALAQYSYKPSIQGNDPAVTVYKPSGEEVGQFRIGDSRGRMMQFMSMAIPALVTGGAGFALAPAALGLVGLGGAAGAGGLSAATLNAMAAGTIGSTLNTAVQGGNAQDYLRGIGTSLIAPVVGQGIGAGIKAIAPGAISGVTDALQSAGLSEGVAADLAEYTKPVLKGAATGLLKGDILGGITDSVLGQITRDVAPSLGLTEPQARAFTSYLRTGDENALVMSLGSGLAKQAMGSANVVAQEAAKQQGIEQAYNDPSRALDVLLEGARDYTPETYDPNAPVTGGTDFDLNALLSTLPYEVQNSALGIDLGQSEPLQQTVIRGERPPEDDLSDLIGIGGGYGGSPPPISHGQTPQKIVIPGKKLVPPEDDLLDLLPYNYTIPELPLLEPPKVEIEKPTAPPIGGGSTTPTTPDKEFDLNSILNLLGGGGQEPVLSQVLAQMPGFDVESMSQYLREQRRKKAPDQQTQLAELFANIGYKG